MLFGRWLPDTKGEYVIAARMVDNAAGQMTVCIPMVMLGYFQPILVPTPMKLVKWKKLHNDLPLSKFSAIRVHDIGAAEWIRHELPEIPLDSEQIRRVIINLVDNSISSI